MLYTHVSKKPIPGTIDYQSLIQNQPNDKNLNTLKISMFHSVPRVPCAKMEHLERFRIFDQTLRIPALSILPKRTNFDRMLISVVK